MYLKDSSLKITIISVFIMILVISFIIIIKETNYHKIR